MHGSPDSPEKLPHLPLVNSEWHCHCAAIYSPKPRPSFTVMFNLPLVYQVRRVFGRIRDIVESKLWSLLFAHARLPLQVQLRAIRDYFLLARGSLFAQLLDSEHSTSTRVTISTIARSSLTPALKVDRIHGGKTHPMLCHSSSFSYLSTFLLFPFLLLFLPSLALLFLAWC